MLASPTKQLNVRDLHEDAPGFDLGYWPITAVHGRNKDKYLIVKDRQKGYVLATAKSIRIIANAPTLEEIVNKFNERVAYDEVLIK